MLSMDLYDQTETVNELLARYGVKFGIYKDKTFKEQLFPFDTIPRIIGSEEFDYLERGFKDDKRDRFYQEAVAETYRLIQDLRIADRKKTNPSYKVAAAHAATVNMDQAEIRNRLEGFVADQAMLALEPDSVRQERHRALYERHTDYVSRLFDSIFVSS